MLDILNRLDIRTEVRTMEVAVFIYALCDPDTKAPVYVGQTINTKVRLRQHMAEANMPAAYGNRVKGDWILSLKAQGKKPELTVLQEVEHTEANNAEFSWVERLRAEGHTLLNSEFKRSGGLMKRAAKGQVNPLYK
jgi:hypothetical protein